MPAPIVSLDDEGRTRLALVAITCVGAFLRLYRLGGQSLWLDEILTVSASSGSLGQVILEPVANTRIPPLYYVLSHFFLRVSEQEFWLRLPAAVSGILTIPLFYCWVRRWLGPRVAIAGALLLAVSPFHLWYSQEARPYTVMLMLAVVSLLCFHRLVERPGLGARAAFVLSLTATAYCHTVAIGFIACLGLVALLTTPRRNWLAWIMTFATVAVLLVPGAYLVSTYDIAPPAPPKDIQYLDLFLVPYTFWSFGTGFSIGPSLADLHMPGRMDALLVHAPILVSVGLFVAGLAFYGALTVWRVHRERFMVIALLLIMPAGLVIAGSLLPSETFNVRYAILSLPAFLVLQAVALAHIPRRWMQIACLAIVLSIDGVALSRYYFDPGFHREDNRGAGAVLSARALPGDIVIVSAGYTDQALKHYCPRTDLQWFRIRGDDVVEALGEERLSSARRLWLFRSRAYHADPERRVVDELDSRARRGFEYSSSGVELTLYEQ